MVNHLCDQGMREQRYKDIAVDEVTKRPDNCPVLAPVECNEQIWEALKPDVKQSDLEALKPDVKQSDFRMKEVAKTSSRLRLSSLSHFQC